MQKYRYYLPPQSKLPFAAGILSGLLCLDNIYTLISMPHYTQYWDYWATLAAALLLCVFCFLFRQRRTELTLIPAAILALIACITPNLVHWLEVGMFFLLLLLWLLRLPKWVGTLCRLAGIVLTVIGSGAILAPMAERISMLSRTGRATAEFVVPFVIRSLGGDLSVMMNSLTAAQASHVFLYRGWEVKSAGNPLAHAILRGAVDPLGRTIPNYHYEDLITLYELYQKKNYQNPAVIVDANHANSGKKYLEQIRICNEVLHSCRHSKEIASLVKGFMIESYIEDGAQKIGEGVYGRSITDPCLGWEKSERLIYDIADQL